MNKQKGYLKRSWEDLTADKDWWKVIFTLGLVNCVPVFGQILLAGYLFDWSKEASWGMTKPLPHKMGSIRRRARYGMYWFGLTVLWTLPLNILGWILSLLPLVGGILGFICNVLNACVCVLIAVATLRSVIYERFYPGVQFTRVFAMALHDPRGLLHCLGILLIHLVVAFLAVIVELIPTVPFIGAIVAVTTSSLNTFTIFPVVGLGILTVVVSVFVWVAGAVLSTLVSAMFVRSVGYWTEQFEPAKWQHPSDPMPFEAREKEAEKSESDSSAGQDSAEQDETPLEPDSIEE